MSLIINLVNLALASAATIIVLFGETNRYGRLTKLGVVAASCLVTGLVVGVAQQVVSRSDDAAKEARIVTLTERAKETSDRLEENKHELTQVRAENNAMREALARMPQERATASIRFGDPGQRFQYEGNASWSRYSVQQGPAIGSGPPLLLKGGERVRYNIGFRGLRSFEPEVYLQVGSWQYPLINSGEFVVFPGKDQTPLKASVIANLNRNDFDVHLVVQTTDGAQ